MKEDLLCLQEELKIIKEEKEGRKNKEKNDKMKYFLLTFYLFTFLFAGVYGQDYSYPSEVVLFTECPKCKYEMCIKASFFGWTCEYCKGYNPPCVNTCQSCGKPKGY